MNLYRVSSGRFNQVVFSTFTSLSWLCIATSCQYDIQEPEQTAADSAETESGDDGVVVADVSIDPVQPIRQALQDGEPTEVLVVLEGAQTSDSQIAGQTQALSVSGSQVGGAGAYDALFDLVEMALEKDSYEPLPRYRNFPILPLRLLTEEALDELLDDPKVVGVHPNAAHVAFLTQTLPLIGQNTALSQGFDGTGTSVAVLDTGLDYTRAAFGCTSVGAPSGCKVPYVADFAPSDGARDTGSYHGTNVAGIVAGVAPGARVLGLDVFNGQYAYSNHIIAAIDWVITNKNTYNIVAINMSLGGGSSTTACNNDVFATAVQSARTAGILSAIATGNSSLTNAISSPACVPAAVSVGAVFDSNIGGYNGSCTNASTVADQVTCFSNSANFMTMVAPGAYVTAAGITMAGTSQATPHVAGAIAVLKAAFPSETAAETVQRLTSSSVMVTDYRNNIVKPRLHLPSSLASCVESVTPTSASPTSAAQTGEITISAPDDCDWTASSLNGFITLPSGNSGTGDATLTYQLTRNTNTAARNGSLRVAGRTVAITQAGNAGPTGSVSINAGATATASTAVTLTISGSDTDGVSTMCVGSSPTCTTFVAYSTNRAFSLTAGTGTKTVYVVLRDALGATTTVTDTILLDQILPTGGSVVATGGAASIAVSWSGFSDANSGVASYKVVSAAGAPPSSCNAGTVRYTGSSTSTNITGLTNGTTYGIRVCARDNAGNLSTGVTASARPAPEYAAPTGGSVTINAGAEYTGIATVTLTLSATDVSGLAQVCMSNTTSCTSWVVYAASKSHVLTTGAGLKTVYVWFRDIYGNATSSPVTDTIRVDQTAPTNASVMATPGSNQITLSWAGATDAMSGVAGYKVVRSTGYTAPISCNVSTVVYNGSATTTTNTGLMSGTRYMYRVCTRDAVGNMSAGAIVAAIAN